MSIVQLCLLLFCCLLTSVMTHAQTASDTSSTNTSTVIGPTKSATKYLPPGGVTLPPPAGSNNAPMDTRPMPPDCSRTDWLANRCSQHPSAPRYRDRPIVIVQPPAPPPVDTTPTSSDWEGCKKTKLNQISLSQNGNLERSKQLDEWLWKNCRSYSEDLRQLEQDQM